MVALIELIDRYNGINNRMIGLGVRDLADALKCSHGCAGNALREPMTQGWLTLSPAVYGVANVQRNGA